MKKKCLLYGIFIILLFVEFYLYKIYHKYGLSLINNYLLHIIKLVIIYIGFRIAKKEKLSFLIYIIIILYLFLTLGGILKGILYPTFTFNSPNKTNTLVVDGHSTFHIGSYRLYEKKYFILKKELPYEPLIGYEIFRREVYTMKWLNENQVLISYESQDSLQKEIVVNFSKK